jgi:hypothetical protein
MPRDAKLRIRRRSEDKREETNEITAWKLNHGHVRAVLGRGRSRLTHVSFTFAPDARRSRTHPSCPNTEAHIRAVYPSWTHTRAIIKGQRGETNGHAGVRRAPCD